MKASPVILLIEDNTQPRSFLKNSLNHRVWSTVEADCELGLAMLNSEHPDLVILDLDLPDMDGIVVTRRLRQLSDLPILILMARRQEQNKIMALDAGADDYLTKPVGSGELHARLQTLMHRVARSSSNQEIFEAGQLRIDLAHRKVFVAEHEIRMTPIEFRLLGILIRHAGVVVTHRQLLQEVWEQSIFTINIIYPFHGTMTPLAGIRPGSAALPAD